MKYQLAIFAKRVSPDHTEFRQVYFPVEMREGKWMPCGPMIPDPVDSPWDFLASTWEYDEGAGDDCGPLEDITPPEGWRVEARLWHVDDYVPPSKEVRDEDRNRAMRKIRRVLKKYPHPRDEQ